MPLVLYQIPPSPPCRAVLMTAEHLGLEVTTRHVDLMNGEHLKPEFQAVNELLIFSDNMKIVLDFDLFEHILFVLL